jgi:hypothetical protein
VDDKGQVRIGGGGDWVTIRPVAGSPDYLRVTLDATGISASKSIYHRDGIGGLASFFGGLASDWRGWDGMRQWSSRESDLVLDCRHDGVGHVSVLVTLGRLPPDEWGIARWTALVSLVVEPGALEVIAMGLINLAEDI